MQQVKNIVDPVFVYRVLLDPDTAPSKTSPISRRYAAAANVKDVGRSFGLLLWSCPVSVDT